jgi:hypothetical protein
VVGRLVLPEGEVDPDANVAGAKLVVLDCVTVDDDDDDDGAEEEAVEFPATEEPPGKEDIGTPAPAPAGGSDCAGIPCVDASTGVLEPNTPPNTAARIITIFLFPRQNEGDFDEL